MVKIKIIKPSFTFEDKINGIQILKKLEKFGRVSHKSEKNITKDSYKKFLKKILNWGHESVIEHEKVTVTIICDRGVSHELVRHRLASYTQESTRYCNYSGKITFIQPLFFKKNSKEYNLWLKACKISAFCYEELIKQGVKPEEARAVLPNSLKTEIVVTANLREWRHIFQMRTQKAAHPQMREVMIPLLKEFQKKIPIIFDDFIIKKDKSLSYPFYTLKEQNYFQS